MIAESSLVPVDDEGAYVVDARGCRRDTSSTRHIVLTECSARFAAMNPNTVTDALHMALARRRPDPELIWHSDQSSQFVSLAFGQQARAVGIAQSMGSRGDWYDNALAQSFFATLKERTRPRPQLAIQGRAAHRGVQVHRGLLQPPPPALRSAFSPQSLWTAMKEGLLGGTLGVSSSSEHEEARRI
jgi:transposase InsO family protein